MRFLGVDVGGTSTRAALATTAGELAGYGRADGANLRSSTGDPGTNAARAVVAALGGSVPDDVAAVVVGAAGAGSARHDEVAALLGRAVASTGVAGGITVVTDIDIAFRSAAPQPDGCLVLAGTGAIAARFQQWRCVQRCDGMGWLLGDEGSGVWIGREVLRAAAAALDGRGPSTPLAAAVQERLGISEADGDPRQALIRAVDDLRPAAWARFAPLAFDADPVAARIVAGAAQRLAHSATAVGATPADPLVLAGGLLASGPLRDALDVRFPHARYAAHPVVGACALAADATGQSLDRDALTRALPTM